MSPTPSALDRSVRKGSSVVMARHGGVPLQSSDMTLFNYLLLRAYDDIEPGFVHHVPMRDVLEYARTDRVSGLQANLERLGKATIEIDYQEADGEGRTILAHFLSYDMSRTERGMLYFAFDPILAPFLRDPKVYAFVSPDRSRSFGEYACSRLYEAMKLQYNKKHAVQSFAVDELRAFFRTGSAHPRPDNFRKFVEKVVREVNSVAEFDVVVSFVRGGQGGAIVAIEFTAVSKSHSKLIEARSVRSVGKARVRVLDKDTPDLLDGKNFHERGGPADLSQAAIDAARGRMGEDDDVAQLVSEWRESMRGRSMTDPDGHFAAWLEVRLGRDADPLLKDLDSDVFGAILGGKGN